MASNRPLPPNVICPNCGQPMKVFDLSKEAKRMGYTVREGAFVIECCDDELTIEDEDEAKRLASLLIEYHQERSSND